MKSKGESVKSKGRKKKPNDCKKSRKRQHEIKHRDKGSSKNLQRPMNRLERNRDRKNRNGKEAQGHRGKMAPMTVSLSTSQEPVK